jgi:AraC family transcriptional regulator
VIEGLNRALTELEQQLTDEVDVDELARIALTSTYHLRRMFSALAGMPLSTYVRRRRMTLAAAEVVAEDATLLEIATRYGYGSAEALGRAFREVHGVTPGEARRTDGTDDPATADLPPDHRRRHEHAPPRSREGRVHHR